MAEETLVNAALTPEMRAAGEALVRELDRRKFLAKAALWLYEAEREEWRLVIATPQRGPKRMYKTVQQAIATTESPIRLSSVTVRDTNHPLIRALSSSIGRGAGVSGTRISRNGVDGYFIEDAYIYRLAA